MEKLLFNLFLQLKDPHLPQTYLLEVQEIHHSQAYYAIGMIGVVIPMVGCNQPKEKGHWDEHWDDHLRA